MATKILILGNGETYQTAPKDYDAADIVLERIPSGQLTSEEALMGMRTAKLERGGGKRYHVVKHRTVRAGFTVTINEGAGPIECSRREDQSNVE